MSKEDECRTSNMNVDRGEKTWLTPLEIVRACGHFDTDPCCPKEMPWRTADMMITEEEDGLVVPWKGRVWLNPPYGREGVPFLEKMVDHVYAGGSGIALLFARTDTRAWHNFVFPYAKGFLFKKKRIDFCDVKGNLHGYNAPIPSVLVAYTWADVGALERAQMAFEGHLIVAR